MWRADLDGAAESFKRNSCQSGRDRAQPGRSARGSASQINIANLSRGRNHAGGDAVALLYVDERVDEKVLDKLRRNEDIKSAKSLVLMFSKSHRTVSTSRWTQRLNKDLKE